MKFQSALVGSTLVVATLTATTLPQSPAQAFGVVDPIEVQGTVTVTADVDTDISFQEGTGIDFNPNNGFSVTGTDSFQDLLGNQVTLKDIIFQSGTTFGKIKGFANFGSVTLTNPAGDQSNTGDLTINLFGGTFTTDDGGDTYTANPTAKYVFRTGEGTQTATTSGLFITWNDPNQVLTINQAEAVTLVPEPFTVLATGLLLGFGGLFQRESQKKSQKA